MTGFNGATNYDSARFAGFELSGFYDTGRFFGRAAATIYDHVRLCPTSDTCQDSRSEEGIPLNDWRNQVPPEFALSATLGARLFDKRLTVIGRVNHVGERAGMPDISAWGDQWVPHWKPYTTADLSVGYRFSDTFQVELTGENIFDEYYVDALSMAQQPGPGRTVRMNATLNF
jgi:hemoglobin/transferrin/lactoferrin receptor protein